MSPAKPVGPIMTGERSFSPNSSTDWSRVAAPASSVGTSSIAASAASLRAHGDLVAGGAVNQVEQQPRQLLAGERAQRRDAVAFALERGLIHQTFSR